MRVVVFIFCCYLFWQPGLLQAQEKGWQENIPVHDPVMIRQKNTYYLFATGQGIAVWSSKDLKSWKREKPVFAAAPEWAVAAVPGFKNHIWAPDISYHKGKYYLYYSVSAFGRNTSGIGLATNTTLDPADKAFKWEDQGLVIQSVPGKTNWNAIDPNLVTDKKGVPYLAFGSFWEGLKLVRLQKDRKTLAQDTDSLPTIASRIPASATGGQQAGPKPVEAGLNPIEAPFIFKKHNYYYLFASIDYCCRGANSTYKMVVGRSRQVTGPFLDKAGVPMEQGGGSLVLEGNKQWYGVGHNAAYTFDKKDYLVFHAYDAADKGKAKLRIAQITWDKQRWPVVQPR